MYFQSLQIYKYEGGKVENLPSDSTFFTSSRSLNDMMNRYSCPNECFLDFNKEKTKSSIS